MNIIIGYERTGKALAHFFKNTGKDFLIFDENPQSLSRTDFPKNVIDDIPKSSLKIEQFIMSPGISTKYSRPQNVTNNFIAFAEENAIPMVSDIELFIKSFPKKEISWNNWNEREINNNNTFESYFAKMRFEFCIVRKYWRFTI